MNTINSDESTRPLGFWLKATDRLMASEFATAFESEGVTRREWRLLNLIDAAAPARHDRPLPVHKLGRLIELGWVTDADGTWSLTDAGRAAKERLGAIVEGIRAKVTDAAPADDLATTMATLERIARAFGWSEEKPLPRGRGGRKHFRKPGHGRHSNLRHGTPDRGDMNGCEHHGHPHGEAREHGPGGRQHGGHGRARFARFAQGAYERGFDAGFTRGRDDR